MWRFKYLSEGVGDKILKDFLPHLFTPFRGSEDPLPYSQPGFYQAGGSNSGMRRNI